MDANVCSKESQKLCVSIVPIFNHLTAEEMNEIVKETTSITYKRGEMIYRAAERSKGLYIVHKGRVKIYRLSETGKEQLVRILEPGDFTGELALFSETELDAYAEAMKTTELCVMNRADFQQFLIKYPAIALKVLTEFSNRLQKTEKQAAHIAMETVETRLALYLADLVEEQSVFLVKLPMSQKDLASHLGTTPETISRTLRVFEQSGSIEQKKAGRIQIVDLDALLLI